MRVLIVEDEAGVAQNLCDLLLILEPKIEILAILETVTDAVEWIDNNESPDLGFFDIRLADGESFEIFDQREVNFPVIFTTGYDEYTLKAFKVNSIDYLLKPIDREELSHAINKYKTFYADKTSLSGENISKLIDQIYLSNKLKHKVNLLIYSKDRIIPIQIDDIAYFYLENDIVYSVSHSNKKNLIDQSLEKIWGQISPEDFFRVNRQFIVARRAINAAIIHYNRKLKLDISPVFNSEVLISKLKVTEFKRWLEGGV